MQDRTVEYPGRFKATDTVTGDEYIFDVERAEGNIITPGTPFNTASMLSNSTARALGLSTAATPNDAFAAIAEWINGVSDADSTSY